MTYCKYTPLVFDLIKAVSKQLRSLPTPPPRPAGGASSVQFFRYALSAPLCSCFVVLEKVLQSPAGQAGDPAGQAGDLGVFPAGCSGRTVCRSRTPTRISPVVRE